MTVETAIDVLAERITNLDAAHKADVAHIMVLFSEREKRYEGQFKASEEAVAKALVAARELTVQSFAASEKAIQESKNAQADVNAKSNEFRGQLKDQNDTMIPRPEANARFNSLEEKIDELRKLLATVRETTVSHPTRNEIATIMAGFSKDITELREYRSAATGKGAGLNAGWGYLIGAVGLLALLFRLLLPPAVTQIPATVYQPAQPGTMLPSSPSVAPTGR